MTKIYLLMCILAMIPVIVNGETKYRERMAELMELKSRRPGDPQLESYLRSLTPEQMLQAAREWSEYVEKERLLEKWGGDDWPGPAVEYILGSLAFYGTEEGGLTDDRLAVLLNCIADQNESLFLRISLVDILHGQYWNQLTNKQTKWCKEKFLTLLLEKKLPERLRSVICRNLSSVIKGDYHRIIYGDKNVRPLRNYKERWRNLESLIRKGEVRLDSETLKALKHVRDEIEKLTSILTKLLEDSSESPRVKEVARVALEWFANLPVPPE